MDAIRWRWQWKRTEWRTNRCRSQGMLERLFNECLLKPDQFRPSQDDLEVIGAFNPGAVATRDGVIILVRIAEQALERRQGQTGLPRWDAHSRRVVIDWEDNNSLAPVDIRVVRKK